MSDPELEDILKKKVEALKEESREVTDKPVILTSESFHGTIEQDGLTIVDFWAEWCAPCRFMEPVFEKLAAKYAGKVLFSRLNVDQYPDIATQYQVLSIPTFILFKKGKPVDMVVGAVGEGGLERLIAKNV